MKTRFITGIFIVLAVTLSIVAKLLPFQIGDYIFDIFAVSIALFAAFEMTQIMGKKGYKVNKFMTALYPVFNYIILLFLLQKFSLIVIISMQILALFGYALIAWLVEAIKAKTNKKESLFCAINTYIACMYPSLLLGLILAINHVDYYAGIKGVSIAFLTMIFLVTMLSDTFAYLVGKTFKGPKLAPKISPNKTISGGVGGLLGGMAGALIVFAIIKNTNMCLMLSMLNLSWWHFMLIGFFGSIVGQCGDLFESSLKRQANIKDSGNIFPGHGGMLDRIDALIFVTTFMYLILSLILL